MDTKRECIALLVVSALMVSSMLLACEEEGVVQKPQVSAGVVKEVSTLQDHWQAVDARLAQSHEETYVMIVSSTQELEKRIQELSRQIKELQEKMAMKGAAEAHYQNPIHVVINNGVNGDGGEGNTTSITSASSILGMLTRTKLILEHVLKIGGSLLIACGTGYVIYKIYSWGGGTDGASVLAEKVRELEARIRELEGYTGSNAWQVAYKFIATIGMGAIGIYAFALNWGKGEAVPPNGDDGNLG